MANIPATIRRLQRSLSLIVWLRGIATFAAILAGTLLVLGTLDWLMQREAPAVRWSLSLLFWVSICICLWWLKRCWHQLPSEQMTALLVERADPDWQGEFAGAANLKGGNNTPEDSTDYLSNRVKERVLQRLGSGNAPSVALSKVFPWIVCFAGIMGVLAGCAVAFPAESYLATSRVVWPLNHSRWPRRTQLRLLDQRFRPLTTKHILTHGATSVDFFVEDRIGECPQRGQLEVERHGEIKRSFINRQERSFKDEKSRFFFPLVLSTHQDELRFRFLTSDDRRMPWHTVSQVRPMTLDAWQLEITPPSYLGLSTETFNEQSGQAEAIVGSEVRVQGRTDRPAQQFRLLYSEEEQQLDRGGSFSFSTKMIKGEHLLTLRGTPAGVGIAPDAIQANPLKQIQLTGLTDQLPQIALTSGKHANTFTVNAEPTLTFELTDDFGLNSVQAFVATAGDELQISDDQLKTLDLKTHRLQFPLKLSELSSVIGPEFEFYLRATDHRPNSEPVESTHIQVKLVSKQEKNAEFEQRLAKIQQRLMDLVVQQTRHFEQTEDIAIQFRETNRLRPEDSTQLRQVVAGQTHIHSAFDESRLSLSTELDNIQKDIQTNQCQGTAVELMAANILKSIKSGLRVTSASVVEETKTLTRLAPSLLEFDNRVDLVADPKQVFSEVADGQAQLISQINQLLKEFKQTRERIDLLAFFDLRISELQEMTQATTLVAQQTISMSVDQLPSELKADLATLANQHLRFSTKMGELLSLSENSAPEFQTIRQALLEENIATTFLEIAEEISANNVSQAVEEDFRVLRGLQELRKELGTEGRTPENQVAQSRDLVQAIEEIQREQTELEEAWTLLNRSEDTITHPLSDQQSALRNRFELLSRSELCRPHQSAIKEILELMQTVGERIHENGEAISLLGKINTELAALINKLRQQQAQMLAKANSELRTKLAELVQQLSLQQQQIRNETLEIEAHKKNEGRLSRQNKRKLIALKTQQVDLLNRFSEVEDFVSNTQVLRLATAWSRKDLNDVVQSMDEFKSLKTVTKKQQDISELLQQLGNALGVGAENAPTVSLHSGELELLFQMQERIIRHEQELLQQSMPNSEVVNEIAAEQKAVSEIFKQILEAQSPSQTPITPKPE